ncbi:hypothetical protein [Streptomyces sp. NPDC015130]|uniref:hypothetical protein n=1 Tax=Streptomyces sp. NPDC015130 TaxID=3364940 RepID=UPI003701E68F
MTEDRLRAALTARAAQVTHHDLRRELPPHGRVRGLRVWYGRVLAALAVAATVGAVCLLALLPDGPSNPVPVLPARPPEVTGHPTPEAPPMPEPAPETPRVANPSG